MKGLVWNDETKGAQYDVVDIPAELLIRQRMREKLVEAVSAIDDDLMMKYLEAKRSRKKRSARHSAQDVPLSRSFRS